MDHRGRADRVNVVGTGRLDLWARRGEQRDHPIARDRVVDELDGTLLADRERAHRVRKDHRLPERQDGKHRRELGLPDLAPRAARSPPNGRSRLSHDGDVHRRRR